MHSKIVNPLFSIIILTLSALIVVSQLYIPIPLTSVFSDYFAVKQSVAIWIGSSFGFAYALGFLILGPLSDRFGRRTLLIPGLFLLGVITFLIGFATSFANMIFLRIIQGFVAATFAPAALAYVGEQLAVDWRATAIACVSTGFMTAGVLGQLYASEIDAIWNWKMIFWSLGMIYIVFSILTTCFLVENRNIKSNIKMNLRSFYLAMPDHLKNINLLLAYLCSFLLLLSFVAMYSGLYPYLVDSYQFNPSHLFSVRMWGLAGMVVAPFSGLFIKKFGSRKVLLFGFLLTAISILLEGYIHSSNFVVFATIPFVAGVAVSAPALISNISTHAVQAKGAAISLYTFVLFIGAGIGPFLANALKFYGFKTLCTTIFVMLILSIVLFISVTKD